MKTTGLMILLLVATFVNAQDMRNFSFSGVVTDKTDERPIEDFIVDVYQGNEIINTIASGKKGKFSVDVFGGSEYTVEIFKEGYFPKRAILRTNVPEDIKKLDALKFDMQLVRISDYEELEAMDPFSTSIFDFPYVIFEYDKALKDFNYKKSYTDHVKEQFDAVADLR